MPVFPGGRLGPYELLSSLGAGGMGEVYRARDTRLDRDVAVKVIAADGAADLDRLHRFEQEARAVAALDHPHILSIHDVGTENGTAYVVFELLEGETLRQRLERGAIPTRKAMELAVQMCRGLAVAHARGIIHRDLKPENLFLTRDGRLKILDFGLAKLSESPEREQELQKVRAGTATEPGMLLGTVGYMSPEQARGKPADARSDLFAVGAILYEMLSGRRAFEGATPADLLSAILTLEPPEIAAPNGAVPAALERVVRRCLEKDPEERLQSARDVAFALEAVSAPSQTPVDAVSANVWMRKRLLLAGAAVVVVSSTVAVAWWWPGPARQSPRSVVLTRLTSEPGVQMDPVLSPDGKLIAYAADRGGNVDLWVQQVATSKKWGVAESAPVRITDDPLPDWQPDWSPDGSRIAFRSERDGGGLYIVPALGGAAQRIAAFGYNPRFSPDGSRVLFHTDPMHLWGDIPYVLDLGGGDPRPVPLGPRQAQVTVGEPAWHPDGKRVSIRLRIQDREEPEIWRTISLAGDTYRDADISRPTLQRAGVVALDWIVRLAWAPSGDAVFIDGLSRQTHALWRAHVDPTTFQVKDVQRVTSEAGGVCWDCTFRLSRDGRSAVFASFHEGREIWSLPFDAATGRVTGNGQRLFEEVEGSQCDVSPDGARLWCDGPQGLWLGDVNARTQRRPFADQVSRGTVLLSPDGRHIVFTRGDPQGDAPAGEYVATIDGRDEHLVHAGVGIPYGWSPDGRWVVGTSPRGLSSPESHIWMAPAFSDGRQIQVLASSTKENLWESRISPDGRWLVFLVSSDIPSSSTVWVTPRAGGERTRLTSGPEDTKPRWSPDGRMLYFLSHRAGFWNVWGLAFEPQSDRPGTAPFQVTHFEQPSRTMPDLFASFHGMSRNRLFISLSVRSSNVWMVENIDR